MPSRLHLKKKEILASAQATPEPDNAAKDTAESTGTPKLLRFAVGAEPEEEEASIEPEEVEPEQTSEGGGDSLEAGMEEQEELEEDPLPAAANDLGLSPAALNALRGSVLLESIRLKQSCSPGKSVMQLHVL
jgi:hypothetical protein